MILTAELRVMRHSEGIGHDIGTASNVFGTQLTSIHVGASQGDDAMRGAYDWWPLTINDESIGELRDDATGLTIHLIAH